MLKKLQPYFIWAIFLTTGSLHFLTPKFFEQIVPPYLPNAGALVAISGVFEILGALGVLPARTRVAAGWGLIALLVAVFPANIYMATDAAKFPTIPAWGLYARLPLQLFLIWWVYKSCINVDE